VPEEKRINPILKNPGGTTVAAEPFGLDASSRAAVYVPKNKDEG
jgi:hypothetical protein